MASILDTALDLAAAGRAVFPVGNDKAPRCPRGHLAASTDPTTIRALHCDYGFVLIGIATGERSGISALDVDNKPGGLEWFAANRHKLPATRTHRTRSGGLHLWFKHRAGLRSSVATIAPGIDVRADAGSCIWWPAAGLPVLSAGPLADWPDWLVPPPKPGWTPPPAAPWVGNDRRARAYAEAALRRAIERVAGAAPGTRNATLNSETYGLLRLTSTGGLSAGEVAEAMAHAAIVAGLERREIEATLKSALSAREGAA
ncbi:bifunctional DNA primase/polymerase [Acidiphilium sp. PM]|uniref:bifunctional DNA primase/polymerase n=1 Tax=Acidiphilium sp. PM TaxID=1043206 RepID=UPI0002144C7F|nr:bifunctional DNA primase/polymerase [Acidiphilium sp. PM]EGO96804.1 hypothetical protein APM_0306 [Acidiphilium sp. PM]